MNDDNKIITCVVSPGQYSGTSDVKFYSKNGYVTGIGLDHVLSVNVTGDQIVIMCESQSTGNRWINVFDAYTCRQINTMPAS